MRKLNIGSSGSAKPRGKFNSKDKQWFKVDETGETKIDLPTFAADLVNLKTGQFKFRQGQSPERRIDPSLDNPAPSPDEEYKRGFVFYAYSDHFFGGRVEICSTSLHMSNAVKEIYADYIEQRDDHPGQIPVIETTGSQPMKGSYGTNFKPIFRIIKWIDRPEGLPDESPVDPDDVWPGGNDSDPSASSAPVPPPAEKTEETEPEF